MFSSLVDKVMIRLPQNLVSKVTISEPGFQLFSRLPQEIRWLIWELALPEPSIVTIYTLAIINSPVRPRPRYMKAAYFAPVLLGTNRESRTIAQKHYLFLPGGSMSIRNGVCFAWQRDALDFNDDYAMNYFCQHLYEIAKELPATFKLRYIIIQLRIFCLEPKAMLRSLDLMRPFGCPDRIILRAERDDELRIVVDSITDFGLAIWAREVVEGFGPSLPAPKFEVMTRQEVWKDLEDTYYAGSGPQALVQTVQTPPGTFRLRYEDESLVDYWKAWVYASVVVPIGSHSLALRGYLI